MGTLNNMALIALPLLAAVSLSSCVQASGTAQFFSNVGISSSSTSSSASPVPTNTNPPCNGNASIQISWAANREAAVNKTGGGYLVYYSTSTPVNTLSASNINVPYVSGATAPTSGTITQLACGTWHFRVVAYSALHPTGSTSGSRSTDSTEVTATLP